MIRSPRRPSTCSRPSSSQLPTSPVCSQPSPSIGVDAVAVAAQQHRAAHEDLAVVGDAHLDAVERPAVVDDAAAGLGHAVGGDDVRWPVGRWAARRRARCTRNSAGSMRAQRRRDERHVGRSRRAPRPSPRPASKPRQHGQRRARDERLVTTDSPPTWASGRHASQCVAGADAEATARRVRGCAHGVVGEHDALRRARGAARRDHERVAVGSVGITVEATLAGGVERSTSGAARASSAARAGGGSRGSTGQDRVAARPRRAAQRVDERRAGRQVERDARPAIGAGMRRATGSDSAPAHGRRMNRWVLGARPRTLPAAVVPVALGAAVGCRRGRRALVDGAARGASSASRCRSASTTPTTTATGSAAPTTCASVRRGSSPAASRPRVR